MSVCKEEAVKFQTNLKTEVLDDLSELEVKLIRAVRLLNLSDKQSILRFAEVLALASR